MKKPCKYAEGIEGEWECTCYGKIDCEYQDVDYNYLDFFTGHKEINVVNCTKATKEEKQSHNLTVLVVGDGRSPIREQVREIFMQTTTKEGTE